MNTIRDWHGDIEEFIDAKQVEEKKAWALIEQGYDGSYNGDAYGALCAEREPLRSISDEFMESALDGETGGPGVTTANRKEGCHFTQQISEGHGCGSRCAVRRRDSKGHACKGTEPVIDQPVLGIRFSQQHRVQLASLN